MTTPRDDAVAAVHFTPTFGAVEENRAALVRLVREAASRAGVVVLPELATTGFVLRPEEAAAWAEPVPGPTTEALAAVARDTETVVVVGLATRAPSGESAGGPAAGALCNAQVVLDADGGVAGVYAKHHLWGADHDWAAPGPTPGALVETRRGRLGLLVCHDLVHPLTLLRVARERPRLLALSTAWVSEGAEPFPLSWVLASALLEGAPLVVANRGGAERGVRFDDPSAIVLRGAVARRTEAGPGPEVIWAPVGGLVTRLDGRGPR
ncbi:MAG: carbon-nitrogen hydrolase family protein [Planctomycetes bacterium]|nr:carbon-nitrogen hydrolase family protein [Planctomycetota bacterium]